MKDTTLAILSRIYRDLCDRRGFDLSELPDHILMGILTSWWAIIEQELQSLEVLPIHFEPKQLLIAVRGY